MIKFYSTQIKKFFRRKLDTEFKHVDVCSSSKKYFDQNCVYMIKFHANYYLSYFVFCGYLNASVAF